MHKLLTVLLALAVCTGAFAVDDLDILNPSGNYRTIVYDWTSDASGDAQGVTKYPITGVLLRAITIPSSTDAPTDDYDITIKEQFPDSDGTWSLVDTDVATGDLADRDTSNTEVVDLTATATVAVTGKLQIDVANAGDSNAGRLILVVHTVQYAKKGAGGGGGTEYTVASPITLTGTEIGHSSAAGNKHLPSGGASNNILQYGGSSGTGSWVAVSGDGSLTNGVLAVTDDSHSHTGTTLSGIDISDDTNLAHSGTSVTLSGDTISHSTNAGHRHIPSGGATGQYIRYGGGSGVPAWGNLPDNAILASAASGAPTITAGCADRTAIEVGTNKRCKWVLDFDQSTDESAFWDMVALPSDYTAGTTFTCYVVWTASSGSGDVVWNVAAVAAGNDDAIDVALGTAATATDTLIATGDIHTVSTGTLTAGGTPQPGDNLMIEVKRDADNGSDTLSADARLIGIRLEYTPSY